MKHTKGPWKTKFELLGEGQHPFHWVESTQVFSCICNLPSANTHPENEANARLIAAAPDLLEACKIMIEYVNSLDKIPCISKAMECVGTARQAIAKAEEV